MPPLPRPPSPTAVPATPDTAVRKTSFAPVANAHTRLLILGSLPGDQSLARQQYYGNKQNRFWMLMSAVTGLDLVALPYEERLHALLGCGVGLWDVVAAAHRPGSLDSAIRERADNDLPGLLARLPQVQTIAFNGGTAARLGLKVLGPRAAGYRIVALPSSSPAYTLAYEEKLRAWLGLSAALQLTHPYD
ncbi:DNA-deoxyinosine glycosylase [Massilia sp. PAMC28688]|uniref:DNA-deoxyinosine glycosylase n=1 Tax=Massilia sp. PAMC28688 TaxID=2861283 RepID=UPI001C63036A|nr:DNA-deoxyinosine glycosylase [Massilia sp. PAMC28688]QYF95779.1 DNA-deoxyinosine glycosylase [Massilia sp. PAMC28688]